MVGIDLEKGVEVISVFEKDGKKKVKFIKGNYIGEAVMRKNQFDEEYFVARRTLVFMNDLYVSPRKKVS